MPVTSPEYYENQLVEINNAFVKKSGSVINSPATPMLTAVIENETFKPVMLCYGSILSMSKILKNVSAKELESIKNIITNTLHPVLKKQLMKALIKNKETAIIKQIFELDVWSAEDLKFMGYQN